YLDEEYLPEYLRPEHFDVLRERMPRLTVQTLDIRRLPDVFPEAQFDALCLSSVFELMSEDETSAILTRVPKVVANEGRVTLRNLMVPRAVPPMAKELVLDSALSEALHARDRSFVYRSFQAYRRLPRSAGLA